MNSETQKLINNLLAEFRLLVVELEEENKELKAALNSDSTTNTASSTETDQIASTNRTSFTANSFTSGTLSSSNGVGSGATSNNNNGGGQTSSSTTTTTTNTANTVKPPPYKSVIKNTAKTLANTFNLNNNPRTLFAGLNRPRTSNTIAATHNSHITLDLAPQAPIRRRRRSTLLASNNTTSQNNIRGDMAAQRGALIVLEGLDRVGKSTLAKKLVEHLERIKKPVEHHRFPDRTTPIGILIDDLLKNGSKQIDDHAMHLLFSANRWELNKQLRHTISSGTTVVVDRYSYSGIAYSCSKRDLTIDWCTNVENGLPKPDLVIYLELGSESQYKRPGFGDERFEVKEFQELIREQYEKIIKSSSENWLRIDVENKGPEQVLGEVILPVKRCLETCSSKPLGDLAFN